MKNFNICIDIDGSITEPYYWLDICNKHFNTSITEDQITEYYIHKVLGIKREDYCDFYEKYKFIIHSNQKLRADASSIIRTISLFSKIYFVTARDSSLELLTRSYLSKNNIPYDDLFLLNSHHKITKAIELNCDVFIEDNYDNAIELSNAGFLVLLIDTNYNKKPLNKNIIRVYDWDEIYIIIKELLLRNQAM